MAFEKQYLVKQRNNCLNLPKKGLFKCLVEYRCYRHFEKAMLVNQTHSIYQYNPINLAISFTKDIISVFMTWFFKLLSKSPMNILQVTYLSATDSTAHCDIINSDITAVTQADCTLKYNVPRATASEIELNRLPAGLGRGTWCLCNWYQIQRLN